MHNSMQRPMMLRIYKKCQPFLHRISPRLKSSRDKQYVRFFGSLNLVVLIFIFIVVRFAHPSCDVIPRKIRMINIEKKFFE